MDGSSSPLDPYTLPNDYHVFYASYKPSQQTNLNWSQFFYFTVFILTIVASRVFKKTLHDHNQDWR